MTEEELTGPEKYLMCMGYLMHIFDLSLANDKPISTRIMSEISSRLDTKFTNSNLYETDATLEKIKRFSCTEIMQDLINEIENEVTIIDDIK